MSITITATSAPSTWKPKRFYKNVDIREAGETWTVELDGREVRTPTTKQVVKLPCLDLAVAVAGEWQSQGEYLRTGCMPLMTLASTVTESLLCNRQLFEKNISKYLPTDSLCFRDHNKLLSNFQDEIHQPIRQQFSNRYGAINVYDGLTIEGQPPEVQENLLTRLKNLPPWSLMAVHNATTTCNSAILGIAIIDGDITVETAIIAANAEEEFQQQNWGLVEGNHDVSRAETTMWLRAAEFIHVVTNGTNG